MALKVGLVGCGRWGMNHLKTLVELKKTGQIASIHACDIKPSKAGEVELIADSFHTDWQQMVRQFQPDIIAIVTPADTHCMLALSILNHCHTLFIEKPIGLSEDEATAIIAKTQEVGGRLLVGHILRFHEAIRQAMEQISAGAIGELQRIEFDRLTTRPPPDYPNIFEAMAIHGIDTACYCFGELEPSRLTVENVTLDDNLNPTNASISIEFPGMKEALVDVGWGGKQENRQINYFGSKGKISVETGQTAKVMVSSGEEIREVVINQAPLPLLREWQFLYDIHSSDTGESIYPQPGSIIRSVKWVESANMQIQTTYTELNERIE